MRLLGSRTLSSTSLDTGFADLETNLLGGSYQAMDRSKGMQSMAIKFVLVWEQMA